MPARDFRILLLRGGRSGPPYIVLDCLRNTLYVFNSPVRRLAGRLGEVSATTRRTRASARGALPGLRVASRSRPSTPTGETPLPAPDRRPADADPARHLGDAEALGRMENNSRPQHVLVGAVAIATIASSRARSSPDTMGQTSWAIQPTCHICPLL